MLKNKNPSRLKKQDGFFYYFNATIYFKTHLLLKHISIMKKIIFLIAVLFLFNSCSPDDGNNYLFELVPVQSVDIPTEFTLGQTYTIRMYYSKPTTCYSYSNLYYEKDLNVRSIAIENAVLQGGNCQETPNDTSECSFNFLVTSNGSYIFRFYQGKNANGENIFLEYEVPVTN